MLLGRHTPRPDTRPPGQTPPQADTPLPETATEAGGTHPTGMHSCLTNTFAEAFLPFLLRF